MIKFIRQIRNVTSSGVERFLLGLDQTFVEHSRSAQHRLSQVLSGRVFRLEFILSEVEVLKTGLDPVLSGRAESRPK